MTASRWSRPPAPPLSLPEVNLRLFELVQELERQQPALEALLAEQQQVVLEYELRYAASVSTSDAKSEDKRKAEAVAHMYEVYLDDDPETDLATRRAVLEMRVKGQREGMHNLRAQMNSMQTLSANLRAEANLAGVSRP